VKDQPMQIRVLCDEPVRLAAALFSAEQIVEAKTDVARGSLILRTPDADRFYLAFNSIVLEGNFNVSSILPLDEDVHSVYEYLIGTETQTT
jgi:hypothetical protein